MRIRRFARPYARAMMDVAGSPEKANALRGELMRFSAALRDSADLREMYANPGVDTQSKLAITQKLAGRMHLSELAVRAVEVLVRNHRINDLDAVLAALTAYVNTALGVAVAEVRSAKKLTAEEVSELAAVLSSKVGKRVELDLHTDPTLLGGFVARIGSEIYDASVLGKIDRFRETLTT
ncbi:MAG TPA: ATP synthase F1 subunit delta [Thermoanaerobaculia bacterium]|nr:ATP synthase F1 subunit delta [Thermoanaerobaculia bacterium]